MPRRQRRDTVGAPMGYHTEIAVVADPDVATIHRGRALFHQIGLGLQGHAGTVIGYDQGDPGRSLTGPVPVTRNPTDAINAIARPADATRLAPVPEYADAAGSNVDDDPYMALAWYRIAR